MLGSSKRSERGIGWIFISIAIIVMLIFVVAAAVLVLIMSFMHVDLKLNGTATFDWVGLQNYARMFTDEKFQAALGNTLNYMIVVVPIQTALALFFAVLLTQKIRHTTTFRTVYFIPTLTSSAALSLIFMFLFSPSGPINEMLLQSGVLNDPIAFLQDPNFAMSIIKIMNIWATVPFYMTIFIAALIDVPNSQYEAAAIDGISGWTRFWKITFPAIRPMVTLVVLLGIIGTMQVFDQAYIVSGGTGGPANSTLTLTLYAYQNAFDPSINGMGYAAAISVFLGLIIFVLTQAVRFVNRNEKI